jgi:hypothetical protein
MRGMVVLFVLIVVQVAPSLTLGASANQPVVVREGVSSGPRVVPSIDPKTGQRYIQLIGQRMPVYPTADITCDGKRLTIPLTHSERAADRIVATYAVSQNTAETMLQAVECRLFIPGQRIALTRQRLRTAWPTSSKSAEAPKVTTTPPPVAQPDRQLAEGRPGVPPESAGACPAPQPIKGNFTTYSGERCIYHMPGGQFYDRTKPERCYASEGEARQDGCRRSRR